MNNNTGSGIARNAKQNIINNNIIYIAVLFRCKIKLIRKDFAYKL